MTSLTTEEKKDTVSLCQYQTCNHMTYDTCLELSSLLQTTVALGFYILTLAGSIGGALIDECMTAGSILLEVSGSCRGEINT